MEIPSVLLTSLFQNTCRFILFILANLKNMNANGNKKKICITMKWPAYQFLKLFFLDIEFHYFFILVWTCLHFCETFENQNTDRWWVVIWYIRHMRIQLGYLDVPNARMLNVYANTYVLMYQKTDSNIIWTERISWTHCSFWFLRNHVCHFHSIIEY